MRIKLTVKIYASKEKAPGSLFEIKLSTAQVKFLKLTHFSWIEHKIKHIF